MAIMVLATSALFAVRAQEPTTLDEIVVTATKRATKLLETPASITVLDDTTLNQISADDFEDFSRLVPGLTAIDSGPGNKRYALRGLQSAGEPEVALYYDEVPISGLPGFALDTGDSQLDLKLWDIQAVEVLRGPQGTLYGNGAMGGTLRVLSKRPALDRFQAAAQAGIATTSTGGSSARLSGMVNVPLVERKLGFRIAAYERNEGGWLDDPHRDDIALPQVTGDDINSETTSGGRISLGYSPSSKFSVTTIAYYQNLATDSSFETYPTFATEDNRYVSKAFVETPWDEESRLLSVIGTYDLDWASIVATTSYQRRTLDRSTDTTRFLMGNFGCTEFTWNQTCFGPPLVPANAFSHEHVEARAGEVRIVSRSHEPWTWTAGVFSSRASTYRRGQVARVNDAGFIEVDSATGDAFNRLFARTNEDSFAQDAIFGEASYAFHNAITVTAGLRGFWSYRSDQQIIVQQFFPGQPVGSMPFQEFKEDDWFKKIEVSYQFSSKALGYVLAVQGFRAGGPNYPGGFTATAPPYGADTVWDYELGGKLELANARTYVQGAVFRIDWHDLQQLVPTELFNYIANGGDARSEGAEAEIVWSPFSAWTISTGLSYSDARLVGPQPAQTNPLLQLHDGDRLANVPRWTTSLSTTYWRALTGQLALAGRIDVSHQSSRGSLTATQNPAYFQIEGGTLTSLHIALESGTRWRVALDIANLFDRFVPLSAKALDANKISTISASRPRTVGVSITANL